ncbi:hypothetical protein DPIF89300162_510020 [Tenacibaculum maritimum]|nr:hypothetical protein DPIF89300162_510020 [Tenacibaculum maritimum]
MGSNYTSFSWLTPSLIDVYRFSASLFCNNSNILFMDSINSSQQMTPWIPNYLSRAGCKGFRSFSFFVSVIFLEYFLPFKNFPINVLLTR